MDEKIYSVKKLVVNLAVKSYQIFLGAMVVGPFVAGKFSLSIFFLGLALTFTCVSIAYLYTKKVKEEEKNEL